MAVDAGSTFAGADPGPRGSDAEQAAKYGAIDMENDIRPSELADVALREDVDDEAAAETLPRGFDQELGIEEKASVDEADFERPEVEDALARGAEAHSAGRAEPGAPGVGPRGAETPAPPAWATSLQESVAKMAEVFTQSQTRQQEYVQALSSQKQREQADYVNSRAYLEQIMRENDLNPEDRRDMAFALSIRDNAALRQELGGVRQSVETLFSSLRAENTRLGFERQFNEAAGPYKDAPVPLVEKARGLAARLVQAGVPAAEALREGIELIRAATPAPKSEKTRPEPTVEDTARLRRERLAAMSTGKGAEKHRRPELSMDQADVFFMREMRGAQGRGRGGR